MNLYVGTSGFAYGGWKGKFYPRDLKADKLLRFYGKHFRTVEISKTLYRMPDPEVLEELAHQVPANFKFVLKAPRMITHFQRFINSQKSVETLLEVFGALKNRQGALVFQLPPNFPKNVSRFGEFLGLLPPRRRLVFDFRNPSWFDDEVFNLMREHGVALCIEDAHDDVETPLVATANWGYLRLRRPEYTTAELKKWLNWMRKQEWRDAFVIFTHDRDGKAPLLAIRFLKLVG